MNVKRLLRFYFSAGNLNAAMDEAIKRLAARSMDDFLGGEYYAEKMLRLAEEKGELSKLWWYLDLSMSDMGEGDGEALKLYAAARRGIGSFDEVTRKAVRRAAVKFARRISRGIRAYSAGVALVDEWYCIMRMDE